MAGGSKDWHWLGTAVLAWPVVWVLRLLWLLHTKLDSVNGLLLCLKNPAQFWRQLGMPHGKQGTIQAQEPSGMFL